MDNSNIIEAVLSHLDGMSIDEKVSAINELREAIHNASPFKDEPVDFVKWVPNQSVHANDYNPNSVAPPEMELLYVSINADGYTQPIVAMRDDVRAKIHGYLPIVQIRQSQQDKTDRMASTIRHNRARGKHRVDAMSDIVVELKRRNWSDEKIAKNLGMDADEVLRLCQLSGIAELFKDEDFSASWDVDDLDDAGDSLDEVCV